MNKLTIGSIKTLHNEINKLFQINDVDGVFEIFQFFRDDLDFVSFNIDFKRIMW